MSKELTPQQRGAMITNSGKSPIASLPEDQRKALLDSVLDRALNGERQVDIARELGVHQTTLSAALLKYVEDDWKTVQVARAVCALDKFEDEIDQAQDMLALNRARERLKSAQWQLERLHRRLFGEQQNQGHNAVQINIGITRTESDKVQIDAKPLIDQGTSTD